MKLRLLTEEERLAHIEKHPGDAECAEIYELKYYINHSQFQETVLVDARVAGYIKHAVEYGKQEAQKDMQAAMGLIRR